MSGFLAVLGALGTGVASALLPLVNAEAYGMLTATRSHAWLAVLLVLALAVGQTAGKLVLFESARRGAGRWTGRWSAKLADSRWAGRATGPAVVLGSATLGLPPLAIVSLAAGAAGQTRWTFGVLCLVGRSVRFAVLVLPVAWAL